MEFLSRDGVRLAYDEQGSGSPPILFVHGWCCDHTYFAPQAEHFKADHRVIAVDLRGHGASDKPNQDYTMAGFADDLDWLCEQLGIERPVVVGHSMGGVIAFEMAARHPERVGAVVALDAPVVLPIAQRDQITGLIEGLKSPAYQDVARGFVSEVLFLPTDDAERRAQVADQVAATPQHVVVSAMQGLFNCDTEASVGGCTAPTLLIYSAVPPAPLPELVDQLRELCPHVVIGQTVGAGHFNQLEVPEQVNAMIERFMQVSPSAAS
jgi:pimeloyl-ACP methyl ester carboxylesterase